MSGQKNAPRDQREAAGETSRGAAGVSIEHYTPRFSVGQQFERWIVQTRRREEHRLARFLTAWLILRGGRDD